MDTQKTELSPEMKSNIRDYLIESLYLDIDVGWCTLNFERKVTVALYLDGDLITSCSDRLPV